MKKFILIRTKHGNTYYCNVSHGLRLQINVISLKVVVI